MKVLRKQSARFILLIGDLLVLSLSLYATLTVRHLALPDVTRLITHFQAFGWLFLVWLTVFFVAGLYDRQTLLFPKTLPQKILQAQVINSLLGVLFFYTIPYFAITPKTILFIFVAISFGAILLWRNLGIRTVSSWLGPTEKPGLVLVASGNSAKEVKQKIADNPHQGVYLAAHIIPDDHSPASLLSAVKSAVDNGSSLLVIDVADSTVEKALSKLYNLMYSNVDIYRFSTLYEELCDRVPLSHLRHRWFIEQINPSPHIAYDFLKRSMDIFVSTVLLLISAVFFPFIALAIWLEDGGPIFYLQQRIGKEGKKIRIAKFRSMSEGDDEKITKVGWFLRRTRLDELPQLISVFRGDLSLIGPRPEIPELVKKYQQEISYYHARHLIKPGISGWAQLKHDTPPKFAADVGRTEEKLSYDLYYIKHRSLLLDVKIALQTIQVILSQAGK